MISTLRDKIHSRVAESENPSATRLADSLVLGFAGALPRQDTEYAKAAGISHVFSISGFHITLVGGWLFAFFYLVFRAIPGIARNWPARYPAMICAWIGILFYTQLSGAAVATQRALLMATLGFAAFLFGRAAISLRNAALCMGALILASPHYVMEPGFQLSFAAIFGLVYFFSGTKHEKRRLPGRIMRAARAVILTDLAATIFTAPFVMHHFHYLPTYSLLGNLLCLPLFSLAIMPLALFGTIAGAFGFHAPLELGARAYGWTLAITQRISELPFAQIHLPPAPGIALAFAVLGFLCIMFITGRRRMKTCLAAACFSAFAAMTMLRPRPVFYATHDHELVAFMTDAGRLQFNKKSAAGHKMTFDSWDGLNGDAPLDGARKSIGKGFPGERYSVDCKDKVCVFSTPEWKLAYVQQFVPLYKNIESLCRDDTLDFIVSYFDVHAPNCRAQIPRGGFVIHKSGRLEYSPAHRIWHKPAAQY
jgi:competence protein ComEC